MIGTARLHNPEPEADASTERSAVRILLAEDDTEMRRLLASALRKNRYEVIEAADGKELIDHISESIVGGRPLHCIITDVRMPKITGTQALKFLVGAGLTTPVIVITAFGDNVTRVDAWLLGASAVLDKPFEIETLMDEIHRLGIDPLGRRL